MSQAVLRRLSVIEILRISRIVNHSETAEPNNETSTPNTGNAIKKPINVQR